MYSTIYSVLLPTLTISLCDRAQTMRSYIYCQYICLQAHTHGNTHSYTHTHTHIAARHSTKYNGRPSRHTRCAFVLRGWWGRGGGSGRGGEEREGEGQFSLQGTRADMQASDTMVARSLPPPPPPPTSIAASLSFLACLVDLL